MRALRFAAFVVPVLLLMALPSTALAHARYKSSMPGGGEVVQASPAQVDMTFTQQVQRISGSYAIAVMDRAGAAVTSGPAVINDQDRSKMSVALRPNLPPGRYLVNWKNVSDADGDPFSGAFAFYVAVQPSPADQAEDASLATAAAGEGGTPQPTQTPGTPAVTSAAATVTPPAVVLTAVAVATKGDGGDHNRRNAIIAAVAVVAGGAAVLGGGWYVYTRRKAG